MANKFIKFKYDIMNYELLDAPVTKILDTDKVVVLGEHYKRFYNPRNQSWQMNTALYLRYEQSVYAALGMTKEQIESMMTGVYVTYPVTYSNIIAPAYPVGVFSVTDKLLGNATTNQEYITLWNADTDNKKVGTLADGGTPLRLLVTKKAESWDGVLKAQRYFQIEGNAGICINCGDNTYVDWGDGTKEWGRNRPMNYCTRWEGDVGMAGNFYGIPRTTYSARMVNRWLPSDRTITVYHSEDEITMSVNDANYTGIGNGTARNIRGTFPERTKQLVFCIGNAKGNNMNLNNITNWNKLTEVESIIFFSWAGGSMDTTVLPLLTNMKKLNNFWCYYSNTNIGTYKMMNSDYFPDMRRISWTFISAATMPLDTIAKIPPFIECAFINGIDIATADAIFNQVAATNIGTNAVIKSLGIGSGSSASAAARAKLSADGWWWG